MWIDGYLGKSYFKYNKPDNKYLFVVASKTHSIMGLYKKPYEQFCKNQLKKYLNSSKKLNNLKVFENYSKKIIKEYKKLSPSKIKKMSNKDIKKNIIKINNVLSNLCASTVFSEPIDRELLKKEYKKINKDENDFENFYENSTLLVFDSIKSRRDKLILKELNKKNINYYNLQWIDTYYYSSKTIKETIQNIKKIKKNSLIKEIKKNDEMIKKNSIKQNKYSKKLPKKLKKLLNFTRLCMYLRDYRRDYFSIGGTALFNLAKEYFKRIKINEKDCIHSYIEDYKTNLVDLKNYKKIIEKRKRGVFIIIKSKSLKTNFIYGKYNYLREKILKVLHKNHENNSKTIIGTTACKGKVKARVFIVTNINKFHKFKSGDILVTSMTRPEFVPIMKKASAIVTDEGGITCHAAIVSRELKKPCIIGTRNATRLLKDGDLIEVDAGNGIIKKLNKLIKNNKK